jgi:DNA topoisomerase-3
MNYICEKTVGPERTCNFKISKIILTRPLEREEVIKLLSTGKSDLLTKFMSKKGRPFSAYLVVGGDGKVGFEFEPKGSKSGGNVAEAAAEPQAAKRKRRTSAPKKAAPGK